MTQNTTFVPIRTVPGCWSEEDIRRMPTQGFQKNLGIVLDKVTKERIIAHIDIEGHHINSAGAVHGGVIMSLADSLGAMGALQNLGATYITSTLESKTNFLRPCVGVRISADCQPLHLGRNTSIWHTIVCNDGGRICAHVWQTQIHVAQIPDAS
ncbi:PaaI family thioesterase [Sinorhizobium terangae]|uniref:PaaI family thioesterase n=1 Tax=Sinorhizobium terangae TaxID=110322 RepID=UPI0024B239DA|nr:PaaI family thioesterase [Sinorhizobium terangae]WFU51682.1 PaaI family thioesterase [Sinorhizobium terangae]